MSTAVIITGHMRTFKVCVHTLRWQVLRHYTDPAFYVSTVDDEDAGSVEEIRKLWPAAPLHVETVEQPVLPEPPESVRFEPYARSVPVQAVLRQLWQLQRGFRLWQEHGRGETDLLRVRPDLFFHSFRRPHYNGAHTPWWGRFGGANDRFAVFHGGLNGTTAAAQAYFETYDHIGEHMAAGCPLHPESLIGASLARQAWSERLRAEFTTLRKNGDNRAPEISPIDLAHAALG